LFIGVSFIPLALFLKPRELTPPQEWISTSHGPNEYIVYNLKNQPGFIVTDNPKFFSAPAQITKETLLQSIEQNTDSIKTSLTHTANEMKQFYIVSTYDFIRKNTIMFILKNQPLASDAQWFKLKTTQNIDGLLIARIEESK
jgi:hypothetical protein